MDFWGFDRSHNSLRLDALVRILKNPTKVDIQRLIAAFPSELGASPLTVQEIELLIAVASGAAKTPSLFTEMEEIIYKALLQTPLLSMHVPASLTGTARDAFVKRVGALPSSEIAKGMTSFLLKSGKINVLADFLASFDSVWYESNPTDGMAKIELGALVGFFEGIVDANAPESLSLAFVHKVNEYCTPEFLAAAQDSVAVDVQNSNNPATGSAVSDTVSTATSVATSNTMSMQIVAKVAEVAALYSTDAGSELTELSKNSITQLEQLEAIHSFHLKSNAGNTNLIEMAFCAHLRVLSVAFQREVVGVDVLRAIVLRALGDPTYTYVPLVGLIARLTAETIGDDEQKLYNIIPLLPDFFGGLDPSAAFHSAREFANVFKVNFATESSRINVLYAFTNKLNDEEFKMFEATHGEAEAVAYISSLLSAQMAFVAAFNSHELANMMGSLLSQKYGVINEQVDCQIIETWGLLAPYLTRGKFNELLEALVQAASPDSPERLRAVKNARISIANKCEDSQFYLEHLLNLLVIKGNPSYAEAARGIFAPLAVLVAKHPLSDDWSIQESSRNAWFSLAAMGVTIDSLNSEDLRNLSIIAKWAPPLVSETSVNRIDSDIQLNPVLVRGTSSEVLKIQRNALSKVDHHLGNPSPIQTMFLASVLLLEGLRSKAGVISQLPYYFAETDLASGEGFSNMHQLVLHLAHEYVRTLGNDPTYTLASVSLEVKNLVVLSAHRVETVRNVASELVGLVVSSMPAALCKSSTLWALLDCVNLLGEAVQNAIEDQYSPKAVFTAKDTGVTLELSDYLEVRKQSLHSFEQNARGWLSTVSERLGAELKPRLCAYIGSGNKTSGKGRRFALTILSSDDLNDNFMSQYFLLNRYDISEPLPENPANAAAPGSIEGAVFSIKQLQCAENSTELHEAYVACATHIKAGSIDTAIVIVEECVNSAFRLFTGSAINTGIIFWNHISRHRPEVRSIIANQVVEQCILSAQNRKGIFSREFDEHLPMWSEMEYSPTDKESLDNEERELLNLFEPHSRLLTDFLRGSFHSLVLVNPLYVPIFTRLSFSWLECLIKSGSLHSLARNLRLQILNFVNEIVVNLLVLQKKMVGLRQTTGRLETMICEAGLAWYRQPVSQWTYGSNIRSEMTSLKLIHKTIFFISRYKTPMSNLLCEFLSQEYNKLAVWHSPLRSSGSKLAVNGFSYDDLQVAWAIDPILIVRIAKNWSFKGHGAEELRLISEFIEKNILSFVNDEESLPFYLENRSGSEIDEHVLYWTQLSPILSINLLSPAIYGQNMLITQLALRSLQSHPVTKCFFYVPQIVQQLRHDVSGWVEEYILEAAKFSQKFAHQIIWNLMANMYNDDEGTVPNDMKPKLEEVLEKMKKSFNSEEKEYYETEFSFFSEVTGISGKLKPYIKKSKPEKKAKIDEEMANIKVPEGVYLPSHPDGTVVDIDRLSGKPLQSHAKAPFMATFKLSLPHDTSDKHHSKSTSSDIWQSAIFKVGDDCRQDVLALQVISVFRSIFNYCGLDVYVFPYKVTATAAGRGIIDVLPKSVSRDMLGREAVNGLDQWFRSKYGGPDSIDFQRARLNFVKSLAAYSVISYLIQFKDRHNGNIMYDADGHIIHIDFGFCFDIVPGGVKFEAAPFKLTKEMVQVMGGSTKALPYQWFEELCVRAFLASRVFADDICRVVEPMLESGLPCFKGHTIKRLRERFALNKSEADAAHFMRSLISKSHESNYTKGYDEFQRITNGIPH